MDPVAHTLFGATLAEAGLKKKTALATGTLIIGANLPDIDAIAMFWGNDYALLIRRGWTHGVVAMFILPLLLTGCMVLYDQFQKKWSIGTDRDILEKKKVNLIPLLMISYLAVLSHPLLDWLNTYGVRLLMPFSGQWFYGDILFIIDPWLWLIMAAAVVLARSESKMSIAGWVVLGTAATALVTGTAIVPLSAKILWCMGVSAILLTRWFGWFRGKTQRIGIVCLTIFGIYLALQISGSRLNTWQAKKQFDSLGIETAEIMPDPLPARLFTRGGVAVTETHYYRYRINLLKSDSFELVYNPVLIEKPNHIAEAALASPGVQGLKNWIRFPYYEIEQLEDGWRVIIRDLRYVLPDQIEVDGIGLAIVELDNNLQPLSGH